MNALLPQVSNYGRWRAVVGGQLQPPYTPTPHVDEEYVSVTVEGKTYLLSRLILCAFEASLPANVMTAVRTQCLARGADLPTDASDAPAGPPGPGGEG